MCVSVPTYHCQAPETKIYLPKFVGRLDFNTLSNEELDYLEPPGVAGAVQPVHAKIS
jgi:hypothetical protein